MLRLGAFVPKKIEPMNIIIQEPQEYSPVELIRLAQYHNPKLKYADFAIAFNCNTDTIAKWMCGMSKPSKGYYLWAAQLKDEWGL